MLTSVLFQARYNKTNKRYDIFMVLQEGNIRKGREQMVYNHQITLIVPTGTTMPKYVKGVEPKQGSFIPLTGEVVRGDSNTWVNSNSLINPKCLDGFDVRSYKSSTSGSWWPIKNQRCRILLFSIPFERVDSRFRLWKNNEIKGVKVTGGDPDSSTVGMRGCDYNNGINMPYHEGDSNWSFQQVYNGNAL